jgi:hypothetical protein
MIDKNKCSLHLYQREEVIINYVLSEKKVVVFWQVNNWKFVRAEFPIPAGLYSRFTYSSWNSSTMKWVDEMGMNNDTRGSGISTPCIPKRNGASAWICQLQGTKDSWLHFGNAALPPVFTMCTVTRYAGNVTGEVLAGPNFFHGHSQGYTGVANYDNRMMTNSNNNVTSSHTNWLILCGQNAAPWHFVANSRSVGTARSYDSISGGHDLGVNICLDGWPCNSSDFAIMEIAIWNKTLSQDEIWIMNNYYSNILTPNNIGKRTGYMFTSENSF